MGTTITLIFIVSWIPQAVGQFLLWTYWWQVKEYRFDRFKVLVRSSSGKSKLLVKFIAIKFLALILSPFSLLPLIVYIFADIYFLFKVLSKSLKKPIFTDRVKKFVNISIGGFVLIFLLSLFDVYTFEQALLYSEIYLLISPVVGILWTRPSVERTKLKEIEVARSKLASIHPLVIAITGSYGKTTTKEFIAHLLSKKYRVEKTTKNQNNEFGVARKIINDFSKDANLFVAEVGAYKKGEIASITSFINPEIGIVTGLEPQHLELFGNYENLIGAKFELIESLPKGGIAVFNVSNTDCEAMAKKASELDTKLNILKYKLVKSFKSRNTADAEVRVVKTSPKGIDFEIKIGKTTKKLFAPFASIHFLENLAGSILVARHLKVTWDQIGKLCKSLETPPGTMNTFNLKSDAQIVDDTYNANPKGFLAALDFLGDFKKSHKVVITSGIIELGSYSHLVHKDLGNLMAKNCDLVILTDVDFAEDIASGLGGQKEKLLVIPDANELIKAFNRINSSNSIVLLEGRLPSKFMDYVKSQK